MKVAALYDVHANLPALEAVLAEVEREGVESIVLGGDCIHGPQPRETLERLRDLGDRALWVRGNTDRLIAGDADSDGLHDWVAEALGGESGAWRSSSRSPSRSGSRSTASETRCSATRHRATTRRS
jgi:3',5'-cyclic AMP phosphodiesterase CpdA